MIKAAHLVALATVASSACAMRGPGLADEAVILSGGQVARMLNQCSRDAPPPGETTWQPQPADIARLEAALPEAVRRSRTGRDDQVDWSVLMRGWRRQYVSIVRGGRRFIYGNFYAVRDAGVGGPGNAWRREPIIVCDGGASFFGGEYDVTANRFDHLAFNGEV